jgi:Helix-turn-helix domain
VHFCLKFIIFSGKRNAGMVKELTIAEVARIKNRDRSTVLRWVQRNFFPNAKLMESPLGDYWLIPETDLDGFQPPKPGPKTNNKK